MSSEAFEAFGKRKVFPNGGVSMEFVLAVPGLRESWDCWNEAWQAARAAALEDAAEACESEAENWRGEQTVIDVRLCAARIRALKEKEGNTDPLT